LFFFFFFKNDGLQELAVILSLLWDRFSLHDLDCWCDKMSGRRRRRKNIVQRVLNQCFWYRAH